MMTAIPDDEKRFSIDIYEDISETDRREIVRMIQHLLDGDAVFAIEDFEVSVEDLDKIETFVDEQLRYEEEME